MIICLSGIDGCGKGTQVGLLAKYLRDWGRTVFLSKAYGDSEKECFSAFIEQWSQEAILFLFQAFHVEQRKDAEKAIKRDEIVIADRWDESYLAYHSNFGILTKATMLRNRLNKIAFADILPDITFLIDVPVKVAKKRLESRGMDFFDKLSNEYHETMRNEYLRIAHVRKWIIINGTQSTQEIHQQIIGIVNTAIKKPS